MIRALYLKADSRLLNPTLDAGLVESAYADDPEAARSEWGAEFRSDISGFMSDELIDRAILARQHAVPFESGKSYFAFCDPSGGEHDAMTLAIAHQDSAGRVVLDKLVVQPAPFVPEATVERFCETLSAYGLNRVEGDRYAGQWVASMFLKFGVHYNASEWDRSQIYVEVLPLFTQGNVDLLDIPQLITELRLLERRPRPGGRGDVVDHPPRGRDDAVNSVCGALLRASREPAYSASTQGSGIGHARIDYDPFSDRDERPKVGVMRRSMTGL